MNTHSHPCKREKSALWIESSISKYSVDLYAWVSERASVARVKIYIFTCKNSMQCKSTAAGQSERKEIVYNGIHPSLLLSFQLYARNRWLRFSRSCFAVVHFIFGWALSLSLSCLRVRVCACICVCFLSCANEVASQRCWAEMRWSEIFGRTNETDGTQTVRANSPFIWKTAQASQQCSIE